MQQIMAEKLLANLDTMDQRVQKEIVDLINNLRRNVKPKPANMLKLTWNEDAAGISEFWIRKCNFNHSPASQRTINETQCGALMYRANYAASWEHVIKAWYSQEENFSYGIGLRLPYGWIAHFTQLVWAKSHEIGCQVVLCNKDFIYSCNFCPGGNDYTMIGLPYESGKPCGRCPGHCDAGLCTNPCLYNDKYINCESLKQDCESDYLVKIGCQATCKCPTEIK
ncbi:cysteine-rich venom protein pseudechetoxin-like [Lissotriton helveticus]